MACLKHAASSPWWIQSNATWIDGSEVIDYVLVDAGLLPSITACGYSPFLERIHGDHRGMFVDFDTVKLFGAPDTRLAPRTERHLKSSNPQHIKPYFESKFQYLEEHNFFHRLEQLKKCRNVKLAEQLDRQLTKASLSAETQVPTYPAVPYSPAIANLRKIFGIYRMILFQYHHEIDLDPIIQQNVWLHHQHFHFPTTYEEAKACYDDSLKKLKQAEKQELIDSKLRIGFLQEKVDAHALHGDLTSAQYLKRLQMCEETHRVFKKVEKARGLCKNSGLSTVEVPLDPQIHPKAATEWRTIECPKEIEKTLLERNLQHFGQSQGTPWTVPPLSQEVNFEASSAITDLLLNGSYTHEDLDDVTELLISHLKRLTPMSVGRTQVRFLVRHSFQRIG
jgi:hypothetical protein